MEGLGRGQLLDVNITGLGSGGKLGGVGQIRIIQGHKQPAVEFDALSGDFAQNAIFLNAFAGGFLIIGAVTGTGMQQAVGAARGAGGDFTAFQDSDGKTALC